MTSNNLNLKKDFLSFCDVRIEQLTNDREKVLAQCEEEFKHEIDTIFIAKIDEINYIKNVYTNDK